jgi:NAD(P)-dependent dehydrogenase (short-subunit alcohol dehydrogenase family)
MTSSLEMQPNKDSPGVMLFKSQFLGKPAKPIKDINLSGKVAIVTGASTGIGFHACIHLLSFQLSHLILAVRSVKKGKDAASRLSAKFPGAKIEVWTLEMSSYESIQAFVRRVEKDLVRLDIVILNAGLVKQKYGVVKSTGHEEVIQVNYISTVLLSILILPALKTKSPSSAPGRLTIVGSGTALIAEFPNREQVPLLKSFDDEAKWDPTAQYQGSKLMGHYYIAKLVDYVNPKDVIVNVVDPGLCKGSDFFRDATGITSVIYAIVKTIAGRSLPLASSTYVDATIVKGQDSHGCYVMDWKICP